LDQLKVALRSGGRTLVAYSGGVDSVFLAKVAHDTLGDSALAVIADSPSLPRRELREALEIGEQFGFPVRVIKTDEMADESYTSNPSNRCYFCKSELFERLAETAQREGWQTIAYGENASDTGDYRPGAVAAREYQVRAPLKEVGMTKAEIRELSAGLGLPTATKPQMACLSSRIPYGEPVTDEALRMIEAAENILRDAGFYEVRVRHHTVGSSKDEARNAKLYMARIEVGAEEFARLFDAEARESVMRALKQIGYAYVTLDLQGYRRGSANEVFIKPKEG
jgi:pyridinium-3,5-biscarboxylic acid mononucleotide sulfurtransferase